MPIALASISRGPATACGRRGCAGSAAGEANPEAAAASPSSCGRVKGADAMTMRATTNRWMLCRAHATTLGRLTECPHTTAQKGLTAGFTGDQEPITCTKTAPKPGTWFTASCELSVSSQSEHLQHQIGGMSSQLISDTLRHLHVNLGRTDIHSSTSIRSHSDAPESTLN